MRRAFAIGLLWLAGCGGDTGPYCAEYVGAGPGEGVALCRDLHEQPVCDDPGATARFERDAVETVRLIDGSYAICDDDLQVVCADRTELPRCLPDLSE